MVRWVAGISMIPLKAMMMLWLVWLASWRAAASRSDRAVKSSGATPQVWYNVLTIAGAVLLFGFGSTNRLWDPSLAAGWGMVGLAAIGFAFTWWARITLGRFWARDVSRKSDHRVIETGPYAVVRHPIYTGLIVACAATAILKDSWVAVAGYLVIFCGLYVKARLEERFLHSELGDAYDAYKARTPMLMPFTGV